MWVYQQQPSPPEESPSTQPVQPAAPARAEPAPQPAPKADKPPARPPRRKKPAAATRDCVLLAAAYLFGAGFAGVLQAVCDAGELEVLAYYLRCWQGLFAAREGSAAAGLFLAEYLTVAGALTALLFLGLSALGPTPVFLFTMLYGLGSGLLTSQLFAGLRLPTAVLYLLLGGVPAAVAAGCLCLFGATALQVCTRLHAFSFARRSPGPAGGGARLLLGQYLLFTAALAPLCGATAGLLCLANRFGLG